jgi:hypothetical protein
MPINFGLLSNAALTGLGEQERADLQKQATTQFLLGSLLSNDPAMGLRSALSVPEQYSTAQRAITEAQEKKRQRAEVSSFLEQYAPTPMQAGQRALGQDGRGPTISAAQNQQNILNAPIDFQRALTDSLRLAGNPAQPQIRETLTALQPKFQGDLRVDASGRVVGSLPTTKDGIQSQFNTQTGMYSANPVQRYMESRILTTPPEVSANTMLGITPQGSIQQMAIPGAAQAVSAIEGAKARGQAEGQLTEVLGADGRTYRVPVSTLLNQPTGQGAGQPTTRQVGPAGAASKLSPAEEAINQTAAKRYDEFTQRAQNAALTSADRRRSGEFLYNAAEQLDPNKATEFLSGAASYIRAIPGVGDKFDSFVGNVSMFNKTRSEGVLKGLESIKGNANAFEGSIVDKATTGVSDPKFVTKYLSALEIAAADKDDARQTFLDNYTGDPKGVYTAWQNSADNPRIYNHPKVNQFLTEQVQAWERSGAAPGTSPVMPAGFTAGRSKSTGAVQVRKPDGSIFVVGQ